ncbi:hypothetical protein GCM10011613_26780 [Cellvibrio zantedeschiae]|uniref:YdbS-like PH domain-containing protein n=1 Tax=Cellvibrio zantedeschiae TaxID=1237077 RepID=A0ABQ3B6C2_9GAMM|nr:PH domain-containing protein [Cellvibrio zantedeschiae]GGY80399.1 hypothetical protein GCM10011613_26780 [Cellvibrio zantedeschiae]
MDIEQENSSTINKAEWHRVSPIAVFYFLIQNIQHALNFWPMLVGALANQNARVWLFGVGIPVLALLVLSFAFLSYWFFRYQFDADKIQIRSGIFKKRRLTLNFERVQEANLEQAIYFRPFELWTLRLESAGSSKEEIALPGIREALATEIKQRVLFNKQTSSSSEKTAEPESSADFTVKLSVTDLIRYGLMHNTLVYLVAILAPLLTQNDSLWRAIGNFVENMGLRQWAMNYLSSHSIWVDVALLVLLLLSSFIVIYSLSIVLAIIKYWNYTLRVQGERFQYEAGLFNRVACGFRKHKLQTVIIRQSFMAGLLKRYSLEIKQTNEAAVKQGVPMQGFMIPVLDQIQLEGVMKLLGIDDPQWQRTLAIQIFWRTFWVGGVLTFIVALIAAVNQNVSSAWMLLPIPLMGILFWKYWYSTFYSLTENGFAIRRGFLGHSITYIPQIKVQKLSLQQGPLGRLSQYGKLSLWSGATREALDYIDITESKTCHESILKRVAGYRGRWM